MRSLTGMEGTTDPERHRLQTAAIANGLIGITAPTMAIWALISDEDWYQDLPEWRKRHFVNFKPIPGQDTIISLPLPFELGTIFGTMPQILGDHITDANPIAFWPTFAESMFPYLRGWSSLLPAGARPALEAAAGYDFFTMREQTPFWVEKTNVPEEQMRAGTTVTMQNLFKSMPTSALKSFGIDNPIEFEHFLSGYTAGTTTAFARWSDEMFKLKDHPGIRPGIESVYSSFTNRFARQTPHGSSRTVDEFYDLSQEVSRRGRGGSRTREDRKLIRDINRDRGRMADIRRQVDNGTLTRTDGDRMIFEIANKRLEQVR